MYMYFSGGCMPRLPDTTQPWNTRWENHCHAIRRHCS